MQYFLKSFQICLWSWWKASLSNERLGWFLGGEGLLLLRCEICFLCVLGVEEEKVLLLSPDSPASDSCSAGIVGSHHHDW